MNIATALELEKVTEFEGEWNGEKFTFTAKSHKLTPRIMQQFADSATKPIEFAAVASDVITDWSLDWNGEPFPPTTENIAKLPYVFVNHVIDIVGACWSGNAPTPAEFPNGSDRADK